MEGCDADDIEAPLSETVEEGTCIVGVGDGVEVRCTDMERGGGGIGTAEYGLYAPGINGVVVDHGFDDDAACCSLSTRALERLLAAEATSLSVGLPSFARLSAFASGFIDHSLFRTNRGRSNLRDS